MPEKTHPPPHSDPEGPPPARAAGRKRKRPPGGGPSSRRPGLQSLTAKTTFSLRNRSLFRIFTTAEVRSSLRVRE